MASLGTRRTGPPLRLRYLPYSPEFWDNLRLVLPPETTIGESLTWETGLQPAHGKESAFA